MGMIRLTLDTFLQAHGLKALQVEKHSRTIGHPLGGNSLYRMMGREHVGKGDLNAINALLETLSDLTGRTVAIGEILEFRPGPPPEKDPPA